MKYHIIITVLALAILGAVLFVPENGPSYDPNDVGFNRAYWADRITDRGAHDTYAEFKVQNNEMPLARQHFSAHVIGELIADSLGAEGVKVCDASFAFGCYHGLFGSIIARGGEGEVTRLNAACLAAYGPLGTGCQHGIGHGILEYTGYARLTDALALCGQTTETVPLLGCSSGVFMEFNAPLTGPAGELAPMDRSFNPEQPYYPCTAVPERYRASCYYELGGWLHRAVGEYEKVGTLCSALASSNRMHCFLGVGAMIAPVEGYEVEKAGARCDMFAASDRRACRAGVWWSFYQVPEFRNEADTACMYGDRQEQAACLHEGDLTRGRYDA